MSMQNLVMSARRKASALLEKMSKRQSALESRLDGAGGSGAGKVEAPSKALGEAAKAGGEIWQLYRMSRGADTVSSEVMDKLAKRSALKS